MTNPKDHTYDPPLGSHASNLKELRAVQAERDSLSMAFNAAHDRELRLEAELAEAVARADKWEADARAHFGAGQALAQTVQELEQRLAKAMGLLQRWQSFSFCRIGANWNDAALVEQTRDFIKVHSDDLEPARHAAGRDLP